MFFFNVVRFRVFSFFLKRASNLPKSVDLVNTIFCTVFPQCGTISCFCVLLVQRVANVQVGCG